jgi:hypothetical protein
MHPRSTEGAPRGGVREAERGAAPADGPSREALSSGRPGEDRWHYDRPPFKGFASRCPPFGRQRFEGKGPRRDVVEPGINENRRGGRSDERPLSDYPDWRSPSARHPRIGGPK